MPWLVVALVAGAAYLLWQKTHTSSVGGWGSGNPLAQGTTVVPGTAYYIAFWANGPSAFSPSGWTPATAADGVTPTVLTPGQPVVWSTPPTAPGTWASLFSAGWVIAAATWNGPQAQVDQNGYAGGALVYGTYP